MTRMLAAMLAASMAAAGCATGPRRPLAERVVPCPCTLDGLGRLADARPTLVVAEDRGRATRRYHPGADRVFRLFDPAIDPVAGNQCAFDGEGRVITGGPAAGTPDRVSPERSVLGHWWLDVRPFHRLGWMEYHRRGWAPVVEAPGSPAVSE